MSSILAVADESIRPDRYLMGVVLVDERRAGLIRRRLSHLRLRGQQRLRMRTESDERRAMLLAEVATLNLPVTVLERHQSPGESDADARALCLAAMVRRLASLETTVTLLIKSRGDRDVEDHKTIDRCRSSAAVLNYQHIDPATDPLMWLPDCFVWPAGAGGKWLDRVRSSIDSYAGVA